MSETLVSSAKWVNQLKIDFRRFDYQKLNTSCLIDHTNQFPIIGKR